jgi:hypothetical protein
MVRGAGSGAELSWGGVWWMILRGERPIMRAIGWMLGIIGSCLLPFICILQSRAALSSSGSGSFSFSAAD